MKMTPFSAGLGNFILISLILVTSALAEEKSGEELFLSMKCNKCHRTEKNPKGPTLIRIANTYGEKARLLSFFEGKTEPIVEPERAKTMKPRRRKIKKLTRENKEKLAAYIMGFKDTP